MTISVVVPTFNGARRLQRLLRSLAVQTADHQVIVVDNGSTDGTRAFLRARFPHVEIVARATNEGFGRAVNIGARHADGETLVLLNDDCVCDATFVERLTGALDPGRRVVMAAGVLSSAHHPAIIESAGMELDRTLLVWEYLHGEPLSILDGPVRDPVGPSAAAAAFDRAAFLGVDGFDERLFAYWEDVDLVLRLRLEGARCALARDARGVHEHSATLGWGSRRKNYLMGFGRGYLLRKWSVVSARRAGSVVARDLVLCLGQAALDRNVAGVRGRVDGYRAAGRVRRQPYPGAVACAAEGPTAARTLARRLRRRAALRRTSRS